MWPKLPETKKLVSEKVWQRDSRKTPRWSLPGEALSYMFGAGSGGHPYQSLSNGAVARNKLRKGVARGITGPSP
jgi:hypothetical protein